MTPSPPDGTVVVPARGARRPVAAAVRAVCRGLPAVALLGAVAVFAPPAHAQSWKWQSSISLRETATNNVNLDPDNARTSDLVTEITPNLTFSERGQNTRVDGFVSIPVVFYARTGDANNSVYPSLNLVGDVGFFDGIFHVEGAVDVSQQFFTPFGAQPQDFATSTDNRYRTTTYRVSPYLQGVTSGNIAYELRNNNVWSNLSGAPIDTDNSRYTQWLAKAESAGTGNVGWRASYDYTDVTFDNEGSLKTQIARIAPFYAVTSQFRVEAIGGYEKNEGTVTDYSGAVYGVGFRWTPTERTNVVGNWEHRFFGSSYLFSFDHRTPLTVWNVAVSRNVTTYPQQLAALQGGTDVVGYVNNLYLSSIPDPIARQQAVQQFMRERGLPDTLLSPVTLYSQQILLQQQQTASLGLIGARNTIFFSVYNLRSEPITASGIALPPLLSQGNDNTQTGGNIVWTNRLTQAVNLVASLDAFRTVSNAPPEFETKQGIAQITLTAPLSGKMTGFIGARYQALSSDVSSDYNETAAFLGISYQLK